MQAVPSSCIPRHGGDKPISVVTGYVPQAEKSAVTQAHSGLRGNMGAAELAHDAKYLLGSLRAYSELITIPGVLAEEYRHLAQELQVLTDRSTAMLGHLVALDTAQLPGEISAELEATVLPDAVLDLLGLLSRMAGRAVTFFCSPSSYLPVAITRTRFERILVNLVKNAAESGSPNSTVAVTLVGMRDQIQDAMALVLTVQSRAHTSSSGRDRGAITTRNPTGGDARRAIGLQVVCELAESSGATVEIEGELGTGMSVSVSWPAIDPQQKPVRPEMVREPLRGTFHLSGLTLPAEVSPAVLAGGEAC